jgi:hypothetical protein
MNNEGTVFTLFPVAILLPSASGFLDNRAFPLREAAPEH